jgi:hypothetical protein
LNLRAMPGHVDTAPSFSTIPARQYPAFHRRYPAAASGGVID